MIESFVVWYAAYGSNLLRRRFLEYVDAARDPTPPRDDAPYVLPHPVYFASSSRRWGGPIAFIDPDRYGARTLGRRWLLTAEQFDDVQAQERRATGHYGRVVDLGPIDGVPVRTFTSATRLPSDGPPPPAYVAVIRAGLVESYGVDDEVTRYLAAIGAGP